MTVVLRRQASSWWPDLLAVAAFAGLTVALASGHLLTFDQRVADWAFAHQPAVVYWPARVLNYLGQGGQVLTPISLILTGLLLYRTRSVRAVLPFAAAFVLTYFTIGPAKLLFDRAAPAFTGPDKTELFNPAAIGKYGMSYPSGHMGNVLVWYTVMALLLAALLHRQLTRREWLAIRVAPVVIVFCTTVYLGFHWVTDSVAGVLLGLVLARILTRIPWDTIPLPPLKGWERPAGL
ncbi:membrane-associated phospholipid phosphatase [Actinoplanes lutulentus]|uniref:phosphatase PAP2 family protein n=1 Tax=Actinoplanes lutulentus TaxID=1287878 RepID=UPI000DBA2766|nr:phosphatase PAP2 family protein [Actinoplanes lutulentus]MBB2945772.1 membrane-associated phospholipid phosphatase [Actinoplanes lutulentus]